MLHAIFRGSAPRIMSVAAVATLSTLTGCASTPQRIVLEPGVQVGEASVDLESGSITVEQDGVVVTAQGAIMPAPQRGTLHPTFWVTVQNNRTERISLRPTDARLVDTFGNQLEPVPMALDGGGREVGYALVDPEIRTYVSLRFGWPYYPLYPYPAWWGRPRYSPRYWRYHPFRMLGPGQLWIMEIRPRPVARHEPVSVSNKREFVYHDAKLTYVVVFPQVERAVKDFRLIVPGVTVSSGEGAESTLEFELVFEQILEAEHP